MGWGSIPVQSIRDAQHERLNPLSTLSKMYKMVILSQSKMADMYRQFNFLKCLSWGNVALKVDPFVLSIPLYFLYFNIASVPTPRLTTKCMALCMTSQKISYKGSIVYLVKTEPWVVHLYDFFLTSYNCSCQK